jgi:hypothetical protein
VPFAGLGEPLDPVPTLGLDTLEVRFEGWFDRIIDEARKALPVVSH